MKYPKTILACIVTFIACHNNATKEPQKEERKNEPITITIVPDTHPEEIHHLWQAEFEDNSGSLRMKRKQPIPSDSLNTNFIINYLNTSYPKITLIFDKISHDTIFVRINKSRYLTEQIGSTGADIYITEAVYNLCELKDIEYVNFAFKGGDHAAPGTYSKTDFINVLK